MRREYPALSQESDLWLINLYFSPSTAPTGLLLESLAMELESHGFQVQVITGTNVYNPGQPLVEQRYTKHVHRINTGRFHTQTRLTKFASWFFFICGVLWYSLFHNLPSKIVFMTTPPFLQAIIVFRSLFTRNKPELILWNQDTYPDVLSAVELISEKSLLFRMFTKLQQWSVSRIDKIIALDRAMESILQQRYGARHIIVVSNWEVAAPPSPQPIQGELANMLRHAKQEFRYCVIHAGNYGWGHTLDTLWDYLCRYPQQRDFFFLFVGGGEKWNELCELKDHNSWNCIAISSYVSRPQFEFLLDYSDFGLVSLDRKCAGLMSPSKIHSYLAHGLPLLYLGPCGSNIHEAITEYGCGFHVESEDPVDLVECLERITDVNFDYEALRQRALRAFNTRYTEEVGVCKVREFIEL